MIWSTKLPELRRAEENLRRAKPPMLKQTELLRGSFDERSVMFEPASYIEIPPRAHSVGKMVIPYAVIDARGSLVESLPHFYAVTTSPDINNVQKAVVTRRSQEAHVVAEDLSLRRGIFTPYARSSSELLVASMISEAHITGYLQDRLAHLSELTSEAADTPQLTERQSGIVVNELTIAMDALRDFHS